MTNRAALYFGILNLLIGLAGYLGPFVTGNQDGLINIDTGQLFGLLAMNWVHAGLHLAFGLYGLAVRDSAEDARTYFWAVTVIFGVAAVLGFLAQAGFMVKRDPEGVLLVLEMAVDTAANLLHLAWAGIALWFALRAGAPQEHAATQPA